MEALIAGIIGVLVFINSLDGDFVYDDNRAILRNKDVLPQTPIWSIFSNDFWGTNMSHSGSHKSYRPITVLSFRFNYILSGFNPWSYHLVNILCHGVATYLFTKFVTSSIFKRKNGKLSYKSIYTGSLFALHPIHTEAVAGVVGRADVLATIFTLLTISSYKKYCDITDPIKEDNDNTNKQIINEFPLKKKRVKKKSAHKKKSAVQDGDTTQKQFSMDNFVEGRIGTNIPKTILCAIVPACSALSLFSKEQGISALPLCIVYDVWIRNKLNITSIFLILFKAPEKYRRLRTRMWGAIFVIICLFMIRILPFTTDFKNVSPKFSPSDNPAASNPDLVTRILTFNHVIYQNALLLVFPLQLCYDWSADAVPLVTSVQDVRNLKTILFYTTIFMFLKHLYDNFKLLETPTPQIMFSCPIKTYKTLYAKFNCIKLSRLSLITNKKSRNIQNLPPVEEVEKLKSDNLRRKVVALLDRKNLENLCKKEKNVSPMETTSQSSGYGSEESTKDEVDDVIIHKTDTLPYKRLKRRKKSNQQKTKNHDLIRRPITDCGRHSKNIDLEYINGLLFSFAFILITFIPASNLFFYVGFVIAERILYLPSAGFCILVVALLSKLQSKIKTRLNMGAIGCIILIFSSVRTLTRNRDWKNEISLFSSSLPINSSKIWANYGFALKHLGKDAEAEAALRNALLKRANMADVHYNMGLLKQEQGNFTAALKYYEDAIKYRPRLAIAYLNKGTVLVAMNSYKEAEETYRSCVELSDRELRDPQAHKSAQASCQYNLGKLLFDVGKNEQAITELILALNMKADKLHSVYNMLGQSNFNLGNLESAGKFFELSLQSKPNHIPTLVAYGKYCEKIKLHSEAEKMFKTALDIDARNFLIGRDRQKEAIVVLDKVMENYNDYSELWLFVAGAYRVCGELERAEILYTLYLKKNPQDFHAHSNLGGVLHLQKKYMRAMDHYEIALRIKPNDSTTGDNLRKLERILQK